MSLRTPLRRDATLPDGRVVHVRIGVPDDSYIPARKRDSEARELLREVVDGLESGGIAPTAGALEPLADRLRA